MAELYVGQLLPFAGDFVIRGTAAANGGLLPVNQYQALFTLLGVTYGGNGTSNFQLPNLQGRAPIGFGQSPGTSVYPIGDSKGVETVTLTQQTLPTHTHAATPSGLTVNTSSLTATPNLTANISGLTAKLLAAGVPANTNDPDSAALAQSAGNVYNDSGTPGTSLANASVTLSGSIGIGGTVAIGGSASVSGSVALANSGLGLPFPVVNPYLAINWLISVTGIFPTRN